MKKFQKFGCLLLAVWMLIALAGCSQKDEWEMAQKAAAAISGVTEDAQLRADTEKLLDALLADDYQSAWNAICQEMDEAEFRSVYEALQPDLRGVDSYELVASYINKSVRNGVTSISVRYMLTSENLRLFVDVARTEGYDGLTAFRLTEYMPVETSGTIGNMQGANTAQWIVLSIGLLTLAFVLALFVDCCCHKMKKKWLWLLCIALGGMMLILYFGQDAFNLRFTISAALAYTCLLLDSNGGTTIQVVFPVGAIVYLCMRKKLFEKYRQAQAEKAQQETQAICDQTAAEAESEAPVVAIEESVNTDQF